MHLLDHIRYIKQQLIRFKVFYCMFLLKNIFQCSFLKQDMVVIIIFSIKNLSSVNENE